MPSKEPSKAALAFTKKFVIEKMLKAKHLFTYCVSHHDKQLAFEIAQAWRSETGAGAKYFQELERFDSEFLTLTAQHPESMIDYLDALEGKNPNEWNSIAGLATGNTKLLSKFFDKYPAILDFMYAKLTSPTFQLEKMNRDFRISIEGTFLKLKPSIKSPSEVKKEQTPRNNEKLPFFRDPASTATATLYSHSSKFEDQKPKIYKVVNMDDYSLLNLTVDEKEGSTCLSVADLPSLWANKIKEKPNANLFGRTYQTPAETIDPILTIPSQGNSLEKETEVVEERCSRCILL